MSNNDSDGTFGFLLGGLFGLAGGVLLGTLYAPKKGTALQEDLDIMLQSIPERIEEELEPDSQTRQFLDKTRVKFEGRLEKMAASKEAKIQADAKKREAAAAGLDTFD